jgi:spore maturation protein CgeB
MYNWKNFLYYDGIGGFFEAAINSVFQVAEKRSDKVLSQSRQISKKYDLLIVNYKLFCPSGRGKEETLKEVTRNIDIPKILYIRADRTHIMPPDEVLDRYDMIVKEHPYKDLNKYQISDKNKEKIFPTIFISPLDKKIKRKIFNPFLSNDHLKKDNFNHQHDVFFLGRTSLKDDFRERAWKRVKKENFDSVGGVQERDGRILDKEVWADKIKRKKYFELIKKSKINLALDGIGDMTLRHMEIMGLGEFMLAHSTMRNFKVFPGQDPEDGVHCATFDNLDDIVDKINYYLNRDNTRKEIARKAQELYNQEYNAEKHGKEIKEFLSS